MLHNELLGLRSVLNLGAGKYYSWSGRQDFWGILECYQTKVAVEALPEKAATWIDTGWVPIQMKVISLLPFPPNSFDVVIGTDFIEHLGKEQAKQMIIEAELVARHYVIWFTPIGFLDTQKYQSEFVYSDLDVHYSGWTPEEFRKIGYEVDVIKNMHNFGDVNFDAMWAWKRL